MQSVTLKELRASRRKPYTKVTIDGNTFVIKLAQYGELQDFLAIVRNTDRSNANVLFEQEEAIRRFVVKDDKTGAPLFANGTKPSDCLDPYPLAALSNAVFEYQGLDLGDEAETVKNSESDTMSS